jgi:hypothetical protein
MVLCCRVGNKRGPDGRRRLVAVALDEPLGVVAVLEGEERPSQGFDRAGVVGTLPPVTLLQHFQVERQISVESKSAYR